MEPVDELLDGHLALAAVAVVVDELVRVRHARVAAEAPGHGEELRRVEGEGVVLVDEGEHVADADVAAPHLLVEPRAQQLEAPVRAEVVPELLEDGRQGHGAARAPGLRQGDPGAVVARRGPRPREVLGRLGFVVLRALVGKRGVELLVERQLPRRRRGLGAEQALIVVVLGRGPLERLAARRSARVARFGRVARLAPVADAPAALRLLGLLLLLQLLLLRPGRQLLRRPPGPPRRPRRVGLELRSRLRLGLGLRRGRGLGLRRFRRLGRQRLRRAAEGAREAHLHGPRRPGRLEAVVGRIVGRRIGGLAAVAVRLRPLGQPGREVLPGHC